ncbi:MAG TPA: glycosyltransferase family 2 protein [Pyrinomonadaceae bacterium]
MRATLEAVKWADEIVVVDSYSTDATLDICREFGAHIVQHEYINSAKQKNWAVTQCRHEWVLQIDADEVLEAGLQDEIEQAIATVSEDVHLFRIPRKNHMLGKWIRYGDNFPDYQTRLFRRGKARWNEREVHAHMEVNGEVRTLRHCLLHNNMPHISKELRNLDRYTRYEAEEMWKQQRHFRWHHLTVRPWLVFFHRYLWLQGFRDGWRGFFYSAYMAIYVFLYWSKVWEMEELGLDRSPQWV